MAVYAYLRVSTERQTEQQQRDAIEAHHVIHGWFVDHGVSGAAPIDQRPALCEALGVLQKGDTLVVAKWDRLARSVMNAAVIRGLIARSGATVAAVSGTPDDTPEGRLMQAILDAFAEYELAVIKARTRAALAVRRREGRPTSHPPYGKKVVDGRLVDDMDEQDVIEEVLHRRSTFNDSFRAIAVWLDDNNYATRRGGPFTFSAVRKIYEANRGP